MSELRDGEHHDEILGLSLVYMHALMELATVQSHRLFFS